MNFVKYGKFVQYFCLKSSIIFKAVVLLTAKEDIRKKSKNCFFNIEKPAESLYTSTKSTTCLSH